MPIPISSDLIARLRRFDSPTISNAIELLAIRDRTEGYASMELRCQFPDLPPIAGYAVTCVADSTTPGKPRTSKLEELLDAVAAMPRPAVVVMQNCGPDRLRSCFIGDMIAVFLDRLGAVAAMTDGGARDLRGIHTRAPGFQVFSSGTVVSHGNAAIVEVGIPVTIAGLTVQTSDLLHGDENGVLTVPPNYVEAILEKAEHVWKTEQEFVDYARTAEFDLESMKRRFTH
jgi:4-hydroxy-4-methyl-2-oxoglutarate aldolase